MRINIRIKLFLIIISILMLTALIFAGFSSFIIEKIMVKQYEVSTVDIFENISGEFNKNLEFKEYLRQKEKGVRGFLTLFDNDGIILASTSPQLSHYSNVPPEFREVIGRILNDQELRYTIMEHLTPERGLRLMTLVGQITPKYFLMVEKPLEIVDDVKDMSQLGLFITIPIILLIGFILAYFFARMFTKPIFLMRKKAHEISNLKFSNKLIIESHDEIGDLGNTINEISDKLSHTLIELQEKNLQLKALSQTDVLTQLANRLRVDRVLEDEIYKSEERGRTFSIILIDIDKFKDVNDTYGHLAGDQVLISIANILKENCRRIDLVGRWGGEEFIVILPDTPLDGAVATAENLRVLIESYDFKDVGQKTASFGVVQYNKSIDIKIIIKSMDDALYRAKDSGRNRVELAEN